MKRNLMNPFFFLLNLHFSLASSYRQPLLSTLDGTLPPPPPKKKKTPGSTRCTPSPTWRGQDVLWLALGPCWLRSWYSCLCESMDCLILQPFPQQGHLSGSYSAIQALILLKCVGASYLFMPVSKVNEMVQKF